jgi:hypothetical protein
VKEPEYTVARAADGYEVRLYESLLLAEVEIPLESEDPLGVGFSMLFDYIGGANQGHRKIVMTAPVMQERTAGEKIPMTKPVLRQQEQQANRVAFVLPGSYSLASAPLPENPRIRLREVPPRRVAVLRFSGYANDTRIEKEQGRLFSLLDRDGLRPMGGSVVAYYNPPWTPPFMRRNEIMVEVE